MSEFDELLSEGFELLLDKTNAPTISTKFGTAKCISSPMMLSKELREHGFWPKMNGTVEITTADYARLQIKDRTVVEFRGKGLVELNLTLKVVGMEPDPADPCVRLTLMAEAGGKAG